jgi:hypothetical protein
MRHSDQPDIVTVVASPPAGTTGPTDNNFVDAVLDTLESKKLTTHRIVRASSVRDIDVVLSEILHSRFRGTIRLQIVGHSISGMLSLGASWIPDTEMAVRAFRYPYYVLDTNPASLGLLAKYAGKISDLMLVGCNIGSASSFGYAVNGRTLTYTLAELLRCLVRGADDVVAPEEFDGRGWYAPSAQHRRPKGWRWVEDLPPVWSDPGLDPVSGSRATTTQWFELLSITSSLLPVPTAQVFDLDRPIHLSCERIAPDAPSSALPELSIDTNQGPAQLLCGGRYLRWMDTYYIVDQTPELSEGLRQALWTAQLAAENPMPLTASR